SCIARIRVGESTVGVVGVEVTMETIQRLLLDFAQSAGRDIRALLIRPFDAVDASGEHRREYRVVIDTRAATRGEDWQAAVSMPRVDEIEPYVARFVARVLSNPRQPPMTEAGRLMTHAFLDRDDWLLIVTADSGER
ncbi:MAG: hypothetical protein KC620_15970, partial [Myxococcales bacterium]|nr:hypothetical protein [Myxococcales bacterium]